MRKALMITVAVLGLSAPAFTPAFAQTGATQVPASPNASSQMPQPMNSMPAGTGVATPGANPAGGISTTATGSMDAPTRPRPMRRMVHGRAAMHDGGMKPSSMGNEDGATGDQMAPPTSAYRGGVGSPLSTKATDLTAARGEKMGSRLPEPGAAANTPRELLMAAQRNLAQGKTGAAQQALEMAETRILSRTIDPSMAGQPDQAAMAQNIAAARRALGSRDMNGAKMSIAAALDDRVPGPGPATTMTPGAMPMDAMPPGAMPMRTY